MLQVEAVTNLIAHYFPLSNISKARRTTTEPDSEPVQSGTHERDMNSMINSHLKASKQDTTIENLRVCEYDIKMDICVTDYGDGSVSDLAQNYVYWRAIESKMMEKFWISSKQKASNHLNAMKCSNGHICTCIYK